MINFHKDCSFYYNDHHRLYDYDSYLDFISFFIILLKFITIIKIILINFTNGESLFS